MGASKKTLHRLIDLKRAGALGQGSRMLELGAQSISCAGEGEFLRYFVNEFRGSSADVADAELDRLADGGTMRRLMQLCGVDYLALDIIENPDVILFDLNTDRVPDHMRGQFDLVTNLGTTEHVFDQYRSFVAIHEFTKQGGVIYHDLPMGGYFYHALFSYTPLFFNHMAVANDYEIIFRHFSKVPAAAAPHNDASDELKENGWPDPGYHDIGIEYIFRKTSVADFRVPLEESSDLVDQSFLAKKRSDIVILPITHIPAQRVASEVIPAQHRLDSAPNPRHVSVRVALRDGARDVGASLVHSLRHRWGRLRYSGSGSQ